MNVVLTKNDLTDIIGKMQGIVPAKPSSPILLNVLLEAIDDQLIVSATDLAVSMRCFAAATVIEEGSIALPARRFFQLVKELLAPQVKISSQTNEIAEITTGTSVFKINGMSKAEFPHLPDLTGAPEFSFTHSTLKEMLSNTVFAAAREDSRYTLNGVQLQIADQKAVFTGTDGKRLAKTFAPVTLDPSIQAQSIIPLKAVEEMIKMLENTEATANLALSHDKISLECGATTLIAKLLAGPYPDVDRVIPKQLSCQFSIHREELLSLLRQVSLFTSESSHSARFTFEAGQLQLAVMSSEVGEGRVSMPVDYSGPKLDIAFNPFFFIDILRHSKDETVKLGLIDSHNPGLVTDTTNTLYVLMPMRLIEDQAVPLTEPAIPSSV